MGVIEDYGDLLHLAFGRDLAGDLVETPGNFRHSFGTLLKANGEDLKTVQEILRHANSGITLDGYTRT